MESRGTQDENYWLEAFSKKDDKALAYFFRKYVKSLAYFAGRLIQDEADAETIVADCFIKIWEKHQDFQTAEKLKAFLFITCRNLCLNYLRDLKRRNVSQQLYLDRLEQSEESILNDIIEAEFLQIVHQEIERLPEKSRAVFKLLYFEGKKTNEIAVQLHMSVQNVRNHKTRAIEILKDEFLKKGMADSFMIMLLFMNIR